MPRATHRWPDLVWSRDHARAVLSRAVAAGQLRRLARGIYAAADLNPEAVVRRHWQQILAREYPGAVLVDRSARWLQPREGVVFIDHPRRNPLVLPGLRIEPREGPGPLPNDHRGPDGIWMSSDARGLLDNLAEPNDRLLERQEVERWVDQLITFHGEEYINGVRDRARAIAGQIRRRQALERLDTIIRAALSTGPARGLRSEEMRARAVGRPIDATRLAHSTELARFLADQPPEPLPAAPEAASRRVLLPFYEAYFSNYIEGTEFTLDEAAEIVFDRRVPRQRPEDAHDILSSYRLIAGDEWLARNADEPEAFMTLLRERHAILMAARPDVGPGRFRSMNVRAGATHFVAWQQIEGTLAEGIARGAGLREPFARALFVHFVISEVHPFADGNGRLARMTMNAELSAAREVRIIVPTGYRDDYLSGLRAASHNNHFDPMIKIMRFARLWTAQMDFSTRAAAEALLVRTNALVDPTAAVLEGIKLVLPSRLLPETG